MNLTISSVTINDIGTKFLYNVMYDFNKKYLINDDIYDNSRTHVPKLTKIYIR